MHSLTLLWPCSVVSFPVILSHLASASTVSIIYSFGVLLGESLTTSLPLRDHVLAPQQACFHVSVIFLCSSAPQSSIAFNSLMTVFQLPLSLELMVDLWFIYAGVSRFEGLWWLWDYDTHLETLCWKKKPKNSYLKISNYKNFDLITAEFNLTTILLGQ